MNAKLPSKILARILPRAADLYQRLELGRRLVGRVARRFLSQNISTMVLFGEAHNPSRRFFQALRGKRLLVQNGDFNGSYGWGDLETLASICPIGCKM